MIPNVVQLNGWLQVENKKGTGTSVQSLQTSVNTEILRGLGKELFTIL